MKALISVSDKTGIVDFAKELSKLNYEILSTGGTAKLLRENKIAVKDVSEYTGFPEMMDGRIKTLHPKIHAGLLALRENREHMQQAEENGIEMIDLVVVNLYPFQKTIEKENVTQDEAIENIDIGGPTMLRAAAKNFKYVTVIVNPKDYSNVLEELKSGSISEKTREKLAVKVFRHTADYDAAIDRYLSKNLIGEDILRLKYTRGQKLRYGENWHQEAAFYKKCTEESSLSAAEILHGKEMSYNNYIDADAALEAVKEFRDTAAVAIVKHTNPCGLATGSNLLEAFEKAWSGDTISAFGSVIAVTRTIDSRSAEFLNGKFVEALIAPGFSDEALGFLKNKSKDIRLIKVPELSDSTEKYSYRSIVGGMLEQSRDMETYKEWKTVTKKEFDKTDLAEFAYKACKHVKSNAIIIAYEYELGKFMVLGMGAGQPNRIDSLKKLAIPKAKENLELMGLPEETLKYCVLASDAFFPFDDTVREAAKHNITQIIQPGGSKKDDEVIAACDELGISMIFTEMRHFRH